MNGLRPKGNNADEWHLFLSEWLDNSATCPNGMTFMAVQIAEAIDDAERRALSVARQVIELAEALEKIDRLEISSNASMVSQVFRLKNMARDALSDFNRAKGGGDENA